VLVCHTDCKSVTLIEVMRWISIDTDPRRRIIIIGSWFLGKSKTRKERTVQITNISYFLTTELRSPALFVKIETDAEITGYGEATIHFFPQAVAGMLEDLRPYLLGEDPRRIEYLWQSCFRRLFMRGGPVTGAAISGLDMALWDILGKSLDVPVYQLLGGLAREKVRLYGHVTGETASEIAEAAKERASRGITAIRFRGFHSYDKVELHDHQLAVEQQVEFTAAIREAVGDKVDILIECHGRYDPEWVIQLAERVKPYRPFFIEDPIRHENPAIMAQVRSKTTIPLAAGERYHNKWEFSELINNNYVNYVRPDICHCGGITEMKKIGAMAETNYIGLVLHNNAGPLGTAASLHAALAIANVVLLEAPWINREPPAVSEIVAPFPSVENGYALPLSAPGLGIEFNEQAARNAKFVARRLPKLNGLDGSVRDW
jgi:galactonate dehydratase